MSDWNNSDWQVKAAREVDELLGNAVRKNTDEKFGNFAGVSIANIADVIEKYHKETE